MRPESGHSRKKSCCNVIKTQKVEKKCSALEKEIEFHIGKMTDKILAMAKVDYSAKSRTHVELLETCYYKITD